MSLPYVARLIIVAPAAGTKNTIIATWLNGNLSEGANVVPPTLGPGLSPTGVAPATHFWCNVALTLGDAKACLVKLCQLAAVAVPTAGQWDNATWAQKKAWWDGVRQTVFTNYGVWCQLAPNDGDWDDPTAVLALRGLQPI